MGLKLPLSKKIGIPASLVSSALVTLNAFGITVNFPFGISVSTVPIITGGVIAAIDLIHHRKDLKKGIVSDARLTNTLSLFPSAQAAVAAINFVRELATATNKIKTEDMHIKDPAKSDSGEKQPT